MEEKTGFMFERLIFICVRRNRGINKLDEIFSDFPALKYKSTQTETLRAAPLILYNITIHLFPFPSVSRPHSAFRYPPVT